MLDSSSSDSELGERVRNVSKVLIKSRAEQQEEVENNAYKRKLGDLIFDASFESGNLGYVEQIDRYEYDLMVRPDVVNPRLRVWFNFTVSNQQPNQCVVFTIVNLSETISLFHEGFTPVARSRLKPNWVRLHEDQVFYYKSRQHGNRLVLSIAFKFSSYDNEHQFALAYPYSYSQLTSFIDRWLVELKRLEKKKKKDFQEFGGEICDRKPPKVCCQEEHLRSRSALGFSSPALSEAPSHESLPRRRGRKRRGSCQVDLAPRLRVKSLCKSFLSKHVYQLSVTSSAGRLLGGRPKVVVFCRSYGNLDGPAQFVCQGMIDFLLSNEPLAGSARKLIEFDFYPMLNPDSSHVGNSRSDLRGQTSLEASSLNSTHFSFYENLQTFWQELNSAADRGRLVIIELRVNYGLIGARLLGNQHHSDTLAMERHLAFPRLLARFASDFYLEHCSFSSASKPSRASYLQFNLNGSTHKGVDQYALEVSPFGYFKRTLLERAYEPYDQLKYFRLAKAIVYALLEYLRPREEPLPAQVGAALEAFQPTSGDIDDLTLRLARHKTRFAPAGNPS